MRSLELENVTPYEVVCLATEILKRNCFGIPISEEDAISQALDLLELAAEGLESRRNLSLDDPK